LNALLLPTRGDVWIAGKNTRDAAQLHEIRRAIQMVFQQPDAQLVATIVEEDVAFGRKISACRKPNCQAAFERH